MVTIILGNGSRSFNTTLSIMEGNRKKWASPFWGIDMDLSFTGTDHPSKGPWKRRTSPYSPQSTTYHHVAVHVSQVSTRIEWPSLRLSNHLIQAGEQCDATRPISDPLQWLVDQLTMKPPFAMILHLKRAVSLELPVYRGNWKLVITNHH